MISSQGSQTSDFDVLNSQRGGGDDAVHIIKINKKIGDNVFSKMPQPTELIIDPVVDPANLSNKTNEPKTPGYMVPKEILDYLDIMIVKKKLPLRTLKFDVEFSKSVEEVVKHLEDHTRTVNNIDKSDLDKLFSIIGYAETPALSVENESDLQNENTQVIADTQEDAINLNIKIDPAVDIKVLRDKYSTLRIEHLKKLKQDKDVYKMMMSQLGGDKSMPSKPEPASLVEARNEYYQARSAKKMSRELSVQESVLYAESEIPNFPIKNQERIKKFLDNFDKYSNVAQISESLASADLLSIEKIVDSNSFGGMRVTGAEIQKEIVATSTPVVEPRKPELDAVLLPSEKLLKMENAKVQDVKVEDTGPKYNPEDIKVELMLASGANFLPKKEVEVEKKVDSSQKADDVTVKLPEKQAPKIKNPFEAKISEKIEEVTPVDSTVADKPVEAQNVFPTEFEDKRLEVQHGFPGNPNEIKVFYDGKHIASGQVGGKVSISKEFKAGFLLADTQEQRALKYAQTIIKTLKVVK